MRSATRVPRRIACVVAVVAVLMPGLAIAAEREFQVEVGGLTGVALPEIRYRPTLGTRLGFWWRRQQPLQLALELGAVATVIPYGDADGEPEIGARSGYSPGVLRNAVTLMPRVAFGVRGATSESTAVAAFFGPTFLWSGPMAGLYAVIPFPTATLALETSFGAGARFGFRAALSYITFEFTKAKGLVAPSIAFIWR